MSNLYNFLAPSDDQLARLRAIQAENQKIADQTGMDPKRIVCDVWLRRSSRRYIRQTWALHDLPLE